MITENAPCVINEIPRPSVGLAGWPWTEESPALPATMPNGKPWPRISIVTPSFNQGQFLEETIRSILLQGYPNLEYIIIDGGSTDESVEIIKKYEPWLTYWVSEKDYGQAHAINKGLQICTGEIVAYLNSDDTYKPGTLHTVATVLDKSVERWMCGECEEVNEEGEMEDILKPKIPHEFSKWVTKEPDDPIFLPQPAVFLKREIIQECGLFRQEMHFVFDYEYWVRIRFAGYGPLHCPKTLATFRMHSSSKTVTSELQFVRERVIVDEIYYNELSLSEQRLITQRRQKTYCLTLLAKCWSIATAGNKNAARQLLWKEIFHYPYLVRYRMVWGTMRRFYKKGIPQVPEGLLMN